MPGKMATADELARIRADYEFGRDSLRVIAERHGRYPRSIVRWAEQFGWSRPGQPKRTPKARVDLRRPVKPFAPGDACPGLAACPLRSLLSAKLALSLMIRIDAFCERPLDPDAAEAEAKLLGTLAQTLERLRAVDLKEAERSDRTLASTIEGGADGPAIKAELARRLARLADMGGA